MSFRPFTVTVETTVTELRQLFEVHHYECIPVVERNGFFAGVITDGDLLRAVESLPRDQSMPVRELNARQLMNTKPVTIQPGETAFAGLRIMTAQRLRWLPVVEGETLLGVVTYEQLEARLAKRVRREQITTMVAIDSHDLQDWLCRT